MRFARTLAALAFGLGTAVAALAADYPTRPVTLIVPFPPGGSTDTIARAIAAKLSEKFGQSFIVDNRAGATGAIGADQVRRAAPDGYTLLCSSLAVFVVNPHLQKNLPYDPSKDFDLLTVAVQAPNVLVAGPKTDVKSVAEVIALLKKDPGKVSFASSGAGSSDHLTAALFWQQTGTDGLHVPYKGGAPAIQDLLGGQVDLSFQNINAVIQHIQSGRLRALAVTGNKRSPLLPNVPTLTETGVKNVDVYSWQAFAAPRGLPLDVKAKLYDAIIEALHDPVISKQMLDQGFEIVGDTPEQFTAFQQQELARWKKVIETGHITIN